MRSWLANPGTRPGVPRELPNPRPPEMPAHDPNRYSPDQQPETPELPPDPMPADPPVELPTPQSGEALA